MSAFETTRTAPFGAIATLKLVQFAEAGWNAFTRWNENRVTRKALAKLSDRELDDIGLTRGDIDLFYSARG